MGALGKDLFDLHRPQTNTKVEFGASAYWVEDRPQPQPYGTVLTHMLAQVCDMKVGELVHVIADAHIYDRHVPIIRELIEREQHPAPKFTLNPDVKDFYRFTTKDITIEDYVTGPQIKNIPIAV